MPLRKWQEVQEVSWSMMARSLKLACQNNATALAQAGARIESALEVRRAGPW